MFFRYKFFSGNFFEGLMLFSYKFFFGSPIVDFMLFFRTTDFSHALPGWIQIFLWNFFLIRL